MFLHTQKTDQKTHKLILNPAKFTNPEIDVTRNFIDNPAKVF